MFTGIIESLGMIKAVEAEGTNRIIHISSSFTGQLKPDQSVSHNGVCLTVTEVRNNYYSVTVVDESLRRSNLGALKAGDRVNLERCMIAGARLDGHIVQGHVDCTGTVTGIEDLQGSWKFKISYNQAAGFFPVMKGSVCINGVSLTVSAITGNDFEVTIIPYTFQHTNFHLVNTGDKVNLEFDIIGKYVTAYLERFPPAKA